MTVQFRRLTGRTGPGSGRPSKLYGRGADEIAVTVPERRYELAGELLAAAVEESVSTGEPAREALLRLAGDAGRAIGAAAVTFQTGSRRRRTAHHRARSRPRTVLRPGGPGVAQTRTRQPARTPEAINTALRLRCWPGRCRADGGTG